MKIEKRDGGPERRVVTAMIVNADVLSRIMSKWEKGGLFQNEWANTVAGWCIDHMRRYKRAPGKEIMTHYEAWAESAPPESITLVERLLSSISDEYSRLKKEINADLILDIAGAHFNRVAAQKCIDRMQGHLDNDEVDKAIAAREGNSRIELGAGEWIDVLQDDSAMERAYAAKGDPVVAMKGAVGEFFADALERDGFVCLQAPEKRGKCAPGNTRITRADGSIRNIRDIVRDKDTTPVLCFNETTQRMEAVSPSGFWYNGDKVCWSVGTRTGKTVTTTDNHLYLTPVGWKELKDIRIGDYIAVPKRAAFFGDHVMKDEEVKFIAYMMAEGGCTTEGTVFTNMDDEINADFHDACRRLGFPFRVNGINTHVRKANPFRRKYAGALWRVSCKEKILPSCMFKLPKRQIALFLRCFFSCDGYNNPDGSVGVCLANHPLIKQIGHLLTRFGVVFRIAYKPSKCNGVLFPAWRLEIRSRHAVRVFVEEINMMSYKRREIPKGGKDKSFLDKFPVEKAKEFYYELEAEMDKKYEAVAGKNGRVHKGYGIRALLGDKRASSIREAISKGLPVMRQSFMEATDTDTGKKWLGSDVLWDEVVSIKNVGVKDTYDIAIPDHHNFIGNDCIIHNSFFLQELGWQAMLQGRKVAMFQVGDLSEAQIMRRIGIRAARRPLRACEVMSPTAMTRDGDGGELSIEYKAKTWEEAMAWEEAKVAIAKVAAKTKTRSPLLKLSVHPNSSISMHGIADRLSRLERDGWTPDMVIIDYADILAPLDGKVDSRENINMSWKYMRRLSQEMHCLVLTATQTDADSYDTDLIRKRNFSEDKRKASHVTCTFSVNQTDDEKTRGLFRLNWNFNRDNGMSESDVVYVAGSLALANPMMVSAW